MKNSGKRYAFVSIAIVAISFVASMGAMNYSAGVVAFPDVGVYAGSLLHYAAQAGDSVASQGLLASGRNPNTFDSMGHTPFYYVCTKKKLEDPVALANQQELVRMFYFAGADDPTLKPSDLRADVLVNILHIDRDFSACIKSLYNSLGQNSNVLEKFMLASLVAIVREYIGDKMYHHPLKSRSKINYQERDLQLFHGCKYGILRQAAEALYVGANIEAEGESSFAGSPLCSAVFHTQEQIVHLLLACNANVNAKTKGRLATPLHSALYDGFSIRLVQLLLDHNADHDAKDVNCQTPLDIARRRRNKQAIELLEPKKARQRKCVIS